MYFKLVYCEKILKIVASEFLEALHKRFLVQRRRRYDIT